MTPDPPAATPAAVPDEPDAPTGPDAPDEPPTVTIIRMTMGAWLSQAIHVACELGIPDRLAEGPATAEVLARATGAHPGALYRLLRALAAHGVVRQGPGGRFEPTPLSAQLRLGDPGTVAAYAHWVTGPEISRAWGELLHAVRTGQTAFQRALGRPFFDHYAANPEAGLAFNRAMTSSSRQVAGEILEAYDFSGLPTVVDVGGGEGSLLAAILRRHPALQGVLFDLPPVAERARRVLEEEGVAARCRVVAGDFFEAVPEGGDAYVLKFVLHDWDDDRAAAILSACRRAMPANGRALVVERVMPEPVGRAFTDQRAAMMDLNMLVLTGGRERTLEEFRALFSAAGLALGKAVPTPSGVHVIEGFPVP